MVKISIEFNGRSVDLQQPISISRKVLLKPEYRASNAFYLPNLTTSTFQFEDQFIGDVERGGSCNVDIHHYTPHNLTHIETSAHIVSNGLTLVNIDRSVLNGVLLVIDLSEVALKAGETIDPHHLQSEFKKINPEISMIGIKTGYSLMDENTDFSGKNAISINADLTEFLHDDFPYINGLILDLPSVDNENDSKLLSHRKFFGIPESGIETASHENKFIVELAIFRDVQPGYYFCILTPPKIETNAAITDILLFPIKRPNE